MKRADSYWCVECDELFEIAPSIRKGVTVTPVCPSCTNRLNIMNVGDYIGNKATRVKRKYGVAA